MKRTAQTLHKQIGMSLMALLVLIMFGSVGVPLMAQPFVEIGTGTTTSYFYGPIYRSAATSSFNYSNYVYLYSSAELTGLPAGAIIIEVAWEKADADGMTGNNFLEIQMENTLQSTIPNTSNYTAETVNSTVVYSNTAYDVPTMAGWHSHQLSTPFIYDGTNLKIAVGHHKQGTATGGINYYYDNVTDMGGGIASSSPTVTSSFSSSYSNRRPKIRITYTLPNISDDAGVVSIDEPTFPTAPGTHNVKATISTLGSNTLTSCNINWAVNGVTQTPYAWTGNLSQFGTDGPITLGSFNFPQGVNEIMVWTTDPNNQTDSFPDNDTAVVSFLYTNPLSGTYTVGGPTADFQDLQEIITAFDAGGMAGPVVFNFDPAYGPYIGGVEFSNVAGNSTTNTITFNGNGSTINEGAATYLIALDGMTNVTIDSFNIINTDPSINKFAIMMRGGSQHITITNNYIDMGMGTTSSLTAGIVASNSVTSATSAGNNAQFVTISGNEIVGGYYGISLYGASSYLDSYGHVITDNIIRDFWLYGIRLNDADSVLVSGNDINRANRPDLTTFYGIYSLRAKNTKYIGNHIHSSGDGSYSAYPIYHSASDNSVGYETEYINNAIYNIGSTSTIYGIYLLGTRNNMHFYHNTVALYTEASNTVRPFFSSGAPNDHELKNNIFSVEGSGTGTKYAIYISSTSTSFIADNNVYYNGATGGTNHLGYWGSNQTTLADWQMATMQDGMSVDANPVFDIPKAGGGTPLSATIDNLGTPIGVTTDIYGNPRSATTPDVGAVEFTGISADLALLGGHLANGECLSTNDSIYLTFTNLIGSTIDFTTNPTTLFWSVTGPVNSNGNIILNSGTLAVAAELTAGGAGVDLSLPGTYLLSAWLGASTAYPYAGNDTLMAFYEHTIMNPFFVDPKMVVVTDPTQTVDISARSQFFPGAGFFFTEICQFAGASAGAPVGGKPSWLGDDYVELTGVPNSDLSGYMLEKWTSSATAPNVTHTFPPGTTMSPAGTFLLSTTGGTNSPVDFHQVSNVSSGYGSTSSSVNILKDPNGTIIDVVLYHTSSSIPANANVGPSDWTGAGTDGGSSWGIRLTGPDTDDNTNWVKATGSVVQDPGTPNAGVPIPSPAAVTGFTWSHNSTVFATNVIDTTIGPWTTAGTYHYVASYVTPCGTLSDTLTVIFGIADFSGDTIICEGDSAMLVIDLPGTSPWTIIATDGMMVDTLYATSMPASIYVNPMATTTYDILEWKMGTGGFMPSTLSHTVVVNPPPVVTLDPLTPLCLGDAPVTLTGGLPAGGTFAGPGVTAGVFDPAVAGAGSHAITYTYSDALGCTSSDMQHVIVSDGPAFAITADHAICEGESTTVEVTFPSIAVPTLFFSEYIEGTSNNKALELFNGTSDTLDLANYRIAEASNGGGWAYWHTFPAGAMLPPHTTWVIVANQVNATYYDTANANEVLPWPSVVHYNGNDARAIEVTHDGGATWTIIDIIGEPNNNPGPGWAVAGVNNATADKTLIRKPTVFAANDNWTLVAGTDSATSEYVVHPVNTFTDLGSHTYTPPATLNVTYLWSNSATTPSITVSPATTTTYYVTVTDAVTNCETVDSVVITVNAVPVVNLGTDYDICDDATTTLDAGAGFTSYLWSTGATTQTIVVDGSVIGTNNTVAYTVTVTNADGCEGTSTISITAIDCTGIDEADEKSQLTVWPNPNDGNFTMSLTGIHGKAILRVVKSTGDLVKYEAITLQGDFTQSFNMDNLAAGVYYIQIVTSSGVITEKVVVR